MILSHKKADIVLDALEDTHMHEMQANLALASQQMHTVSGRSSALIYRLQHLESITVHGCH